MKLQIQTILILSSKYRGLSENKLIFILLSGIPSKAWGNCQLFWPSVPLLLFPWETWPWNTREEGSIFKMVNGKGISFILSTWSLPKTYRFFCSRSQKWGKKLCWRCTLTPKQGCGWDCPMGWSLGQPGRSNFPWSIKNKKTQALPEAQLIQSSLTQRNILGLKWNS